MKNKFIFIIAAIMVFIGIILLANTYEFAENLFMQKHIDAGSFDTEYMRQSIATASRSLQILGAICILAGLFPFALWIKKK